MYSQLSNEVISIIEINMFPNMNIIRATYYRVTTFIHIYPKIFVLRLFHEILLVIIKLLSIDVHVQSHPFT